MTHGGKAFGVVGIVLPVEDLFVLRQIALYYLEHRLANMNCCA
ncbi:MAG TPA: hypothetical protein VFI02_21955 [Armatimonadota bacterium]|nr:hypothetical protein [Armatimonadota bacterium]